MEQNHTPGPWTVQLANSGARVAAADGTIICQGLAGNRANARLIAAAPELLEALQAARRQLVTLGGDPTGHDGDAVQRVVLDIVDAALAKAAS